MGYFYLTLVFALSVLNFIALLFFFRKQKNNYMFIVFAAVVVSSFGHWLLGFSNSLEAAIIANKVNYLGSAFFPMLMFFTLVQVCRIHIHQVFRILLVVLSCLVLFLAMSVGYSSIYYTSVEYVVQSGVGNYVATYGWGHDVFNAMIVLYLILDIGVIVYACLRSRDVSFKNILAMFILQLLTVLSFFISRKMENDMLIMPFVYVMDQFFLLYINSNVKWYDISRSVIQSMEKDDESGFISFSSKGGFLGCNANAYKFFPELSSCRMDSRFPEGSCIATLFDPMLRDLYMIGKSRKMDFWFANRHFKCDVQKVHIWGLKIVYLFRIQDDTNVQLYVESLGKNHSELLETIAKNDKAIQAIQEQMIVGMANMVESRDSNTGGHIKRTSQVVKILVDEIRKDKESGLSDGFFNALISAAPMHDLGKIAVDDQILRKPGRFTDEEFLKMKTHAEKGAVIVENLLTGIESPSFVKISKNVAHFHHERWDGTGYPLGLRGADIPVEARIMAVADVFDALVSRRCYKESMSFSAASELILAGMGRQFDPALERYFVACKDLLKDYYISVEH